MGIDYITFDIAKVLNFIATTYSHIYIAIHKRGHGLNMVVIDIITHFMSYAYNSLAPLYGVGLGVGLGVGFGVGLGVTA